MERFWKDPKCADFIADIIRFDGPSDLEAHLAQHDPKVSYWAEGVVVHHTWKPTRVSWRGLRTIHSMMRYYQQRGWDRGPHLFLAPDGLWQFTPLNYPGIHAGVPHPIFNRTHFGLEVVGNFDAEPLTDDIRADIVAIITALQRWRGVTFDVRGHRETGSPKSCPGRHVSMDLLRQDLQAAGASIVPIVPASRYRRRCWAYEVGMRG